MSFTYGVSPQPEQAPENSKSGLTNCEPLGVSILYRFGSVSGRTLRKKSQFLASCSRSGTCAAMLIALKFDLVPSGFFLMAGQALTHSTQPVQSSGATCNA